MVVQEDRGTDGMEDDGLDATDLLKTPNMKRTKGQVEQGMPMAHNHEGGGMA